ncbi:hypothetical protein WDZ16_09410 [Pseudokineococcus marinus]|uniref:ABC-2 type transport system permease protein n=1 Tax=Pseudokineococcus marinus TaxID=351215 RepID=A0A849BKE9_9ACTN|nr:hypothetical protein [Pseudokineococcus marinus]NNH21567.1 hypothetical protein [Pseudokineococcus marinus]
MIRAELLALTTTTATRVAAAVSVVGLLLTQLAVVLLLPALARGDVGPGPELLGDDLPAADLASALVQRGALDPLGATTGSGSLGLPVLALALLGVLAGTGDHRHGGIVGAVLAAPRRWDVVGAKAVALTVLGLALGAVLAALSAGTLLVALAVADVPLAVAPVEVAALLTRGVLAVCCVLLLGLAVGTLVRGQLAGVLVMLAVLLGEPLVAGTAQLLTGSAPAWAQVMPVALTHAAVGAGPSAWAPTTAAAALVALAALALAAAAGVLRRRDL